MDIKNLKLFSQGSANSQTLNLKQMKQLTTKEKIAQKVINILLAAITTIFIIKHYKS